jgi:hypothetical protein
LMVATSQRADVFSSFGSGDGRACLRPTCVNLAAAGRGVRRGRREARASSDAPDVPGRADAVGEGGLAGGGVQRVHALQRQPAELQLSAAPRVGRESRRSGARLGCRTG